MYQGTHNEWQNKRADRWLKSRRSKLGDKAPHHIQEALNAQEANESAKAKASSSKGRKRKVKSDGNA